MPGLSRRQLPLRSAACVSNRHIRSEKRRTVTSIAALVVLRDRHGERLSIAPLVCQKSEDQLSESLQCNRVRFLGGGEEPIAELQETFERRFILPDEACGLEEVAAVGDEIPIAAKSSQAHHLSKVDQL